MSIQLDTLEISPFVPHDHADIEGCYPPGAMPELAYKQYVKKYHALESVEVFRIHYMSDGLRVSGLMAVPKHVQPANHPLLVYNRGGFQHYGMLTVHSAMRNMVPFAEKGYIVFASNYRGNDGGEGEDHFGGDDVSDVLNLLKLAKAHEAWDQTNSYMIGHSRGGMMTLRALAMGADVNAAVSIAGLADFFIGGDEAWRKFLKYLPEDEQNKPETMLKKRSGVHWPEKIKVPLLLLHGDGDDVVVHEHSQRMHEVLGEHRDDHALHIYPAGNHALVRDWADVLARCSDWMEQHVQ